MYAIDKSSAPCHFIRRYHKYIVPFMRLVHKLHANMHFSMRCCYALVSAGAVLSRRNCPCSVCPLASLVAASPQHINHLITTRLPRTKPYQQQYRRGRTTSLCTGLALSRTRLSLQYDKHDLVCLRWLGSTNLNQPHIFHRLASTFSLLYLSQFMTGMYFFSCVHSSVL